MSGPSSQTYTSSNPSSCNCFVNCCSSIMRNLLEFSRDARCAFPSSLIASDDGLFPKALRLSRPMPHDLKILVDHLGKRANLGGHDLHGKDGAMLDFFHRSQQGCNRIQSFIQRVL